jgi:hypothetical protein
VPETDFGQPEFPVLPAAWRSPHAVLVPGEVVYVLMVKCSRGFFRFK